MTSQLAPNYNFLGINYNSNYFKSNTTAVSYDEFQKLNSKVSLLKSNLDPLTSKFSISGNNILIGTSSDTTTFQGTLNTINTTNFEVKDNLITLNKGNAVNSSGLAGINIADGLVDNASYIRLNINRDGFELKAKDSATAINLNQSLATTDAPTFSGLTNNGPTVLGRLNQGGDVISLNSDTTVGTVSANKTLTVNGPVNLGSNTTVYSLNLYGHTNIGTTTYNRNLTVNGSIRANCYHTNVSTISSGGVTFSDTSTLTIIDFPAPANSTYYLPNTPSFGTTIEIINNTGDIQYLSRSGSNVIQIQNSSTIYSQISMSQYRYYKVVYIKAGLWLVLNA